MRRAAVLAVLGIVLLPHAANASPRQCGGLAGLACAAKEWCDFGAEGQCGKADRTGTCRSRPQLCPMIYAPVCGCDGKTYGSACMAHGAGVAVMRKGEC